MELTCEEREREGERGREREREREREAVTIFRRFLYSISDGIAVQRRIAEKKFSRQCCMTLAVIRKSILSSICSSESCTLHTI